MKKTILMAVVFLILASPAWALRVFDANSQYLGVMQGFGSSYAVVNIFIPSLRVFIPINTTSGDIPSTFVYFENCECQGEEWVTPEYTYNLFRYNGQICIGKRLELEDKEMNSYAEVSFEQCTTNGCEGGSVFKHPMVPVKVFTRELPFTLPVALPLRFRQ